MSLFCRHDYEIINQLEVKSEFDIVHESGRTPYSWLTFTRQIVTDMKCSKCKKFKRLIVKTAQ